MNAFARITLLAALLGAMAPAQAAIQTWNFNGTLDSGVFNGETFAGSLSFDDAGLSGIDEEWINLGSLSMTFLGQGYSLADAPMLAAPEAYFLNGTFLGASYVVESSDPQLTLVAGILDIGEAYFSYDPSSGNAGAGSIAYTLAPVPEPRGGAMLLAGLALLGLMARRRV